MAEEIWVVEVNLDPLEFRVQKAVDMLKTNALRVLIKAGGMPGKFELANWVTIAMARSKKTANEKLERFKNMTLSEKAHITSTGQSLYLKL